MSSSLAARPVAGASATTATGLAQTPAQRSERLAFTFCRLGTIGLIAWLLTPPLFVLLAAIAAVVLYGRAVLMGVRESRCFLRRPALIMGTWAGIALIDAAWLLGLLDPARLWG
ncbi:MAG: hypothetical protein H0X16_07515 [Chloroflexi bacterium]|nr:hypothetical protein [Chloroflexota bacterium]